MPTTVSVFVLLYLLLDAGNSQFFMYNPAIGLMFQSIARQVVETIHNGNASCADDLLSKMTLLKGGIFQLAAMTANTTSETFQTFLPTVKIVLAKGKPEFARIKYSDKELQDKFNFSIMEMQQFRTLHSHIGELITKLESITASQNVSVSAIENEATENGA